MNIFRLSIKNMTSRPLNTTLSLVLLTLGVGMIALLLQVNRHIQQQMENNIRGIDMVVGAKGSPLQLILSAVYHIDAPTGNISLQEAEALKKHRLVEYGIPLSYGDSYKGYRIVGTDHQYTELYNAKVAEGELWQQALEVTVGARAAANLNLKLGDTFAGAHGLTEGGSVHEEHLYTVVGIFDYTNSVLDQLILTPTESVWQVHQHHEEEEEAPASARHENQGEHETDPEHRQHGDGETHGDHESHGESETNPQHENQAKGEVHQDQEKHQQHEDGPAPETGHAGHEEDMAEMEITAMLVKFRNPMGLVQLPRMVNENTSMQAAIPTYEISRLFGLMGVGIDTLSAVALVIMIVSGFSVFISLYNALKDRQYEMALMRTYGASRSQLVWLVVQEGLLLVLGGFLLGMVFSRVGLLLVSRLMEASYHYEFSGSGLMMEEWWLLTTVVLIGLLAAVIPAFRVFKINISKTLADA